MAKEFNPVFNERYGSFKAVPQPKKSSKNNKPITYLYLQDRLNPLITSNI